MESPFIASRFPLTSVDSLEYQASTVATGGTHITIVTGPFGYSLPMTRTTLVTSRATDQAITATLTTVTGPFGYPLPMPSTTLVTSTETIRVTDTAPPLTHGTSGGSLDQSTRRDNIIFGVVGVVIAFGAFAVGLVTYKLAKKTYQRNRIGGRRVTSERYLLPLHNLIYRSMHHRPPGRT